MNLGNGDGTFKPGTPVSVSTSPVLADFNGDVVGIYNNALFVYRTYALTTIEASDSDSLWGGSIFAIRILLSSRQMGK